MNDPSILKTCFFVTLFILSCSLLFVLGYWGLFFFKNKRKKLKTINVPIVYLVIILSFMLTFNLKNKLKIRKLKSRGPICEIIPCINSEGFINYPFFNKKIVNYENARNEIKCERKKIAICMFYTQEIEGYGRLTQKINKAYAKRHGYTFYIHKESLSSRSPSWNKVKAVESILHLKNNEGIMEFDYVMWIDADAIFNKQEIKIESLLDTSKDFILCDDYLEGVNLGVFIVKNSNWSKNFFKLWWLTGKYNDFAHKFSWEQNIFSKLYLINAMDMKNRVEVRQRDCFNTEALDIIKKENWDDTYVVHLMGTKHKFRKKYFANWLEKNPLSKS